MKKLVVFGVMLSIIFTGFGTTVSAAIQKSNLDQLSTKGKTKYLCFDYRDEKNGAVFTVPNNWKQKSLSKERKTIDAKFVSTGDDIGIILYGSQDLYAQMLEEGAIGYSRNEINISLFSKSKIAESLGISKDKVSKVTYSGVTYYKYEMENMESSLINMSDDGIHIILFTIDNGWMYQFQFSGINDYELYNDFESLLDSVQYPIYYDEENVSNDSNEETSTELISDINEDKVVKDDIDEETGVIAFLIITIVIILIFRITYKSNNGEDKEQENNGIYDEEESKKEPHKGYDEEESKKEPNKGYDEEESKKEPHKDYDEEESNEQRKYSGNDEEAKLQIEAEKEYIYCPNCKQKLPSDSIYCHMCGTKVDKGVD